MRMEGEAIDEACSVFADAILAGEIPGPMNRREGRKLKFPEVPRMPRDQLVQKLRAAFASRDNLLRALAEEQTAGKAGAHVLAFLRGCAYLEGECPGVAYQDAVDALAHSPSGDWAPAHRLRAKAALSLPVHSGVEEVAAASVGHACASVSSEGLLIPCIELAAVSAREAFEVDPFDTENESLLKDVAKRLPERERRVLMEEGAQGLMEFMEDEAFARAPEFLKPRPKWFYYYEWMTDRLLDHFPKLPEPVVDKMLTMEADELNLLLEYPEATKAQVKELVDVYVEGGRKELEKYKIDLLEWEEVKALKGPATVGLGDGISTGAPGERRPSLDDPAAPKSAAMLPGGSDDEGREGEKMGELPPDRWRDKREYEIEVEARRHAGLLAKGGAATPEDEPSETRKGFLKRFARQEQSTLEDLD